MKVPNPAGIRAGGKLPYSSSISESFLDVRIIRLRLKSTELGLLEFP